MKIIAVKALGWILVVGSILAPTISTAQDAATTNPTSQAQSQVTKPELPDSPESPATAETSASPTPAQPSGTAAAAAVQLSGNPVSRPAGAAIAPPTQHRVRSLLIKMGVIAGAGVAVGTVAALTLSSPSRVPGSPGRR